jgi:hypothetical protein
MYPRRNIFVTNVIELSSIVDRTRAENFSGPLRTKGGINALIKSRNGRKKENIQTRKYRIKKRREDEK